MAADGGVFAFNTGFFGAQATNHLNAPMVGMAATPDGQGLLAGRLGWRGVRVRRRRVLRLQGASHLNDPVVGMAATPDGDGYWLVAADGGVFADGDAGFFGSLVGHN